MRTDLEQLARRVANDGWFLAAALSRYAASENLDDTGLAAQLGCPITQLTPLRLCRMPRAEAAPFQQDVRQIAERFGVRIEVLSEIVRRGVALIHLQDEGAHTNPDAAGLLLAARDRSASAARPSAGE